MYTIKVGPYTIRVDDKGRHEVIGKEEKKPQRFYLDDDGCYHVAAADLKPEPRP